MYIIFIFIIYISCLIGYFAQTLRKPKQKTVFSMNISDFKQLKITIKALLQNIHFLLPTQQLLLDQIQKVLNSYFSHFIQKYTESALISITISIFQQKTIKIVDDAQAVLPQKNLYGISVKLEISIKNRDIFMDADKPVTQIQLISASSRQLTWNHSQMAICPHFISAIKRGGTNALKKSPDFSGKNGKFIICINQQTEVQSYRIIYLIMKGKNIWNVYSHLSPQQWQIKQSNASLKLINNYSDEQFTLVRITPFCQSMLQSLNNRSFYPIPCTPKIIMPKYQIDPSKIQAFVQTQVTEVCQIFKKMPCDILILEKLKTVIRTVEMLAKKYGFFRITPHMLKATKRESVLVWMNQRAEFQVRKYPIVKETPADSINIMVNDLFSIFLEDCQGELLCRAKEKLENEKITTFENCIVQIDKYIAQQIKKARTKKITPKITIPHFLRNKSLTKNASMNDVPRPKNFLTPKSTFKKGEKKNLSILPKIKSEQYLLIKKSVPPKLYHPPDEQSEATSKSFSNKNKKIMKMIQSVQNLQSNQFIKNQPLTVSQNFNNVFFLKRKKTEEKKEESLDKSMDEISVTKKSIQEMDQESTKCDKKNFRDSSNSLATTNFYHSITSSGRTKLLEDEGSFQKKVTNSFGEARNPKSLRPENRFKVKASKIIEEYNCQDGTQNSPESHENSEIINNKSECRLYESEIQKDFYDLLYHDASKDQQLEQMEIDEHFRLQEEFSKVLN